jgi:hypothetical protein
MEAATTEATYVYGVLRADAQAPALAGIGGAQLKEITSNGLAALVSDMPPDRGLTLGREEMTTHARVLEDAIQHGTVLPMRFGVVMAGEPAVKEQLLDAFHAELEQQLEELTGKVELRVRVVYEENSLMREVVHENREIAKLRDQVRGADQDATYYKRIELGEMVAQAVERKRDRDAEAILQQLAPMAISIQVGEPANERVVVSTSFLVERDRMQEFDEAVDALGRAQADRMRIKYTGPLPPHSFVQLQTSEA